MFTWKRQVNGGELPKEVLLGLREEHPLSFQIITISRIRTAATDVEEIIGVLLVRLTGASPKLLALLVIFDK